MVLEENELDSYINGEVPVPEGDEAKALHKKKLVSSLKTPKAIFDSPTKFFEWRNINRKMTLRNQLKNVKIQNAETIQSYFTRVS